MSEEDPLTTPPPDPEDGGEQARLAEELAEELSKLRVEDVVVNALMTAASIGYRHVTPAPERDLEQTRLAIETMRALTPVLASSIPPDLLRDLNAAVANLQLAYAHAVTEANAGEEEGGEPPAR